MLTWIKNRPSSELRRLTLLIIASVLAFFFGFIILDPKVALNLVNRFGYYWVFACAGLFFYALGVVVPWRQLYGNFRLGGWVVILVITLMTTWIHLAEKHGFKVVNDEIMLISSSQRMHDRRETATVVRAYYIGGPEYTLMEGYMDKRPLFFPFMVSVLHDTTGYRPENAFVLNALLTAVFLGLLYLVLAEMIGRSAGLCGLLLWMTLPLFTQAATGAGFELLNLVMILMVMLLGLKYVKLRSENYLNAFCLGTILLAQVRYESILFVIPVAITIIYIWVLEKRFIISWALVLSPLLLVIYPLQANVFKILPSMLQLGDRPSAHGLYSIAYFYDNLGKALSYFLSFDYTDANSHLLALFGVIGLGLLILQIYRKSRLREKFDSKQVAWFVFILALAAQSFLMLCYFWGAYDDYITVRLSLPTQLMFVLAFIYIYPELIPLKRRWSALGILCVLYIFAWTMPVVSRRGYARVNFAAEYNNWCRSYISGTKDRNFLVIDPASRVWSLYGVPCVGYEKLAEKVTEFIYHYNRHSFNGYLLVQRIELADAVNGTMRPVSRQDFQNGLSLETISEVRYSPSYAMRLSRVVAINELELRAWAERHKQESLKGGTSVIESLPPIEIIKYNQEWLKNLP